MSGTIKARKQISRNYKSFLSSGLLIGSFRPVYAAYLYAGYFRYDMKGVFFQKIGLSYAMENTRILIMYCHKSHWYIEVLQPWARHSSAFLNCSNVLTTMGIFLKSHIFAGDTISNIYKAGCNQLLQTLAHHNDFSNSLSNPYILKISHGGLCYSNWTEMKRFNRKNNSASPTLVSFRNSPDSVYC